MLKQTDKDKLKALGLDIDAIIAAHTDTAEKDITILDGSIFTDQQLTDRDAIKIKEGEKSGEKKATEIAKTEIKKHAGIDLTGERWGDIGTELKKAINSSGDEKVKALQDQNALLLADKESLSNKVSQAEMSLKNGMFEVGILSKLPANSLGLSQKEILELSKIRGYQAEQTEAGVVWKKNGEILSDSKTHAPLPEDKAIAHIWESEKWSAPVAPAPQGGRGGVQKPIVTGGGIKNRTQAEAAWNDANPGKNMQTPEGMAYYNELAKQTDFNMYE